MSYWTVRQVMKQAAFTAAVMPNTKKLFNPPRQLLELEISGHYISSIKA
jgi:hypothetical protein